ncbi:hypothetical protein [Thermococcus sp.]
MELAYKLAILPPIGAAIGRGLASIFKGTNNNVIMAFIFVILIGSLLAYAGWLIVKAFIIGFYPEEKGTAFKSLVLWFACFIAALAIMFA